MYCALLFIVHAHALWRSVHHSYVALGVNFGHNDRLVDLGRLNFWTGFYTESGDLVMSKSSVAVAYMKSWFLIDALSLFPFEWAIPSSDSSRSSDVNAVALLKSARLVRAAKMLRLLRAVKLLRLLRLPRMLSRLEAILGRSVLHLAAVLGAALLLCHASACVFFAVSKQVVVLFPVIRVLCSCPCRAHSPV